jgi:hypothetical protein
MYVVTEEWLGNQKEKIAALESDNARLKELIQRSDLEEVDGTTVEADGCGKPVAVPSGKILVAKSALSREKQLTEALQSVASNARRNAVLAADNARLREALRRFITINDDCFLGGLHDTVTCVESCQSDELASAIASARAHLGSEAPNGTN